MSIQTKVELNADFMASSSRLWDPKFKDSLFSTTQKYHKQSAE